ncbi:hypothetical protein [Bifidobacterium castoris]|uniref:Uncharacterized protein n=1 Tax=Bifidobacterium castoris TaxID=2306972 RepID=A0A430F5D1_9BIFI|nr:hypothetical protein [Bifidobacterium castoris]RSX46089.1 hypothetical protein D2E22_1661 [Bifidobacterium castoris]
MNTNTHTTTPDTGHNPAQERKLREKVTAKLAATIDQWATEADGGNLHITVNRDYMAYPDPGRPVEIDLDAIAGIIIAQLTAEEE